jgi:hypothetical protein
MYSSKIVLRAVGVAIVAFAMVFASASFAQQQGRIRGQVEKTDGGMLSLKQRDGTMLDVKLADDARVSALVKASLDDIKKDSFIAVAGMPRPDGSIEAFSVHIFLPAQRGVVADRHFNWDAKPGSTMTNAYVESSVAEKDGQAVQVKFKDGEKKIIVTPATAITAVAPGNKDELKPGAQIIIMASDKQPDGSVLAKNLYIGRNLTPAM